MMNSITLRLKRNWSTITFFLVYFSGVAAAAPVARNECANPPLGTFFCEDFEGVNPKANFNDYDGNPDTENQVVTDIGPASDTSNKAIRFRAPAGQRGGADLTIAVFKWMRFYNRTAQTSPECRVR